MGLRTPAGASRRGSFFDRVRDVSAGDGVHTYSPVRYATLPSVCTDYARGFRGLTKPAFMRRPWHITPCPAVPGWAFLCFVGIISTVSRQLRYSPSRACVCLPPGFLTLWLYLPSCRFAHGYCRGLALCMFVICVCFARSPPGSLWPSPASHRVSS